MFKTLQKIGKAFMLPIAILPAAGLLLGIGGALSNPTTVKSYPALGNPILQDIFQVMSAAGSVIFENLALLLSIGLCIGLAKRDKGTAALAGITGFLVMTATTKALVSLSSNPDRTIDTGVIGSLVIGAVAVWLHNRYHNIELPAFLGFFGGSRFVPIVTAFAGIIIGAFFFLAWPPVQAGMVSAGTAIAGWGVIGTFFYGFLMRLAGAVGLHHMIYPMFWYTPLGGSEVVAGQTAVGAQKIFFAQLADPNHVGLFTHSTKYFAGRFATMMFGLPGACLAMWQCVPKGRRAKYTGLFAAVAFTSFLTGITEPIEYMFLFVAPLLYVFHSVLDGISFLVADLMNIRIGNTFSGGAIDYLLFGVLQGESKTHWLYVLPIGAIWFALYYFSFMFFVKKLKIATPGHLEDTMAAAAPNGGKSKEKPAEKSERRNDGIEEGATQIIAALGGPENIEDVDACITRLRVSVKAADQVDKAKLKNLGATEVFEVGGGVQAVYGAKAILYKNAINAQLGIDD